MAIKVALLVIAALIAVAATYPSAAITSKELFYPDCNEHTIHEATLLGEPIELKICSKRKCIMILHNNISSLFCYFLLAMSPSQNRWEKVCCTRSIHN